MGKASKGSRKGKKAWRANISTDDIDEFFEKQTRDSHAGAAAIPSLSSDSLFYVDKPAASASASAASASGTTTKDIPVKRKIEKKREKVLYHESVLKRNPFVQPVPSSVVTKKEKKKAKKKELQETHKEKSVPMDDDSTEKNLDIWGGDCKGDTKAKKRSTTTASVIPAVEVEPPGCSFNPPFEAHQDSLAQAVADEMRKIYTKELGPKPVPLIVPGEAITEEDKFFLDADDADEDVSVGDGDQDADAAGQRKNKTKRVTRVELNRRARRKDRLRAEVEAKKIENLSKEIDSLPNIIDEIAKEDDEKLKKRIRRTVTKEERLKSGPPRLGRHKFEPAPVQVLLTEEISGSLRNLKGCCNLARDRYKSIEKRGMLAPNKRMSKRR
ncbi:ribosome biogenesis protein NOP53 [Phragmites australis]|uniref:ribosome biogenesis protein NOP53 n=1 Tax=Phragmites australis TaxID=29695 RepID=UPI002D77A21C|nr:ribosome biogenesis protein NOP53 [Phragmites australis]